MVPQEIVWLAWTNKKINQKKKDSTSCCVGAGVDVLIVSEGCALDDLESNDCRTSRLLFFTKKSMLFTGAYCTSFYSSRHYPNRFFLCHCHIISYP